MEDPSTRTRCFTLRSLGWSLLFWTAFEAAKWMSIGRHDVFHGYGTLGNHLWRAFYTNVYFWTLLTPVMFGLARSMVGARRGWILGGVRFAAVVLLMVCLSYVWVHVLVDLDHYESQRMPLIMVCDGLLAAGVLAVATNVAQLRRAERSRGEALCARLEALRSQLQPHFLFNTLQAIGATARNDADATVRMTALLGDLLRQSLRERRGDLVTLAQEGDLLTPYVQLQRLRFGDRLTIELDLPDDLLEAEVPDLLLQPLVENALRHGIEATPGAGLVVVRARREGRDLVLQVTDDGAGPPAEAIDGVGLGTTRARLQGLFGGAASLTMVPAGVRGTTVTVRLPLRLRRGAHAA